MIYEESSVLCSNKKSNDSWYFSCCLSRRAGVGVGVGGGEEESVESDSDLLTANKAQFVPWYELAASSFFL